MRGVLRKAEKKSAGPPQRLPWEDSETALGKPSQRKWCRERKKAGQPSLLFSFFSYILCFACLHIWSIWHLRLFARDLDEFLLWNSNGDGGYLWLIHTVFPCETLLHYSGQGAHRVHGVGRLRTRCGWRGGTWRKGWLCWACSAPFSIVEWNLQKRGSLLCWPLIWAWEAWPHWSLSWPVLGFFYLLWISFWLKKVAGKCL